MIAHPACAALLAACEYDPFAVLGLHAEATGWCLRVFRPQSASVAVALADDQWGQLTETSKGIFEWHGALPLPRPWRLRVDGVLQHDAYAFPPLPSADDLFLFNAGRLHQAWLTLGANAVMREGVAGVCFRVWAPNAERVSVVGDFNHWDGRVHPMASLGVSGVWELFIPELSTGALYRFELRVREIGRASCRERV